ncbi:hypothetical protein Peur_022532 [Populus x canadensis]
MPNAFYRIGKPLAEVQTSRTCSLHWRNFAEQLDIVDHREVINGLFFICVSHIQANGRSLSPAFGVEIVEPSEKFVLEAQI